MVCAHTWASRKSSTQVPKSYEVQKWKKKKTQVTPRKSFAIILWGKCTDFLPGPTAGIKEKSVCQHFIGHRILILLHEVNLRPTNVQTNDSDCELLQKPRRHCRWLSSISYGNKSDPGDEQVNFWLHWYSTETISEILVQKFVFQKKNATVQIGTSQSLLTFIQLGSQTPEKFREILHF